MRSQSKHVPDAGTEHTHRTSTPRRRAVVETLRRTLDTDPDAIRAALANLRTEEVALASEDGRFRASRCALYLDALDMIVV